MKELRGTKKYPYHTSCGGVVINQDNKVLLLGRKKSKKWAFDSWHLPKGTQIEGEDRKETARREIKEETGYLIKVEKFLTKLKSTYQLADKTKVEKTTYYYLCHPVKKVSSTITEHDNINWLTLPEAKKKLSQFPIDETETKVIDSIKNI